MNNNALETDTELGNSIEPDNIKIVYMPAKISSNIIPKLFLKFLST